MASTPKRPRGDHAAQPHDGLVKWTFSQQEHAIGLLRAALPPEVAAAVDFRTLRVEKDTFVDSALKKSYSDVILSARMGADRIYFHVLVEHQRKVEALMVLRVLHYMVLLWRRLLRDEPKLVTLPPIVPLLIHHSDTGWTAATAFQDVIAGKGPARDALERHIPRFDLRLIDLSEGRAANLVEEALTALGKVAFWCMSVAGDDERYEREIGHIAAAIDEVLRAPHARDALEPLLRYLASTHRRMRRDKVARLLMNVVGPKAQEVIVTFLDEIELRGERKGERKGERQGRERMLLAQLAARFGKVPASAKTRIHEADDATLAAWAVEVLTAETLERVFEQGAAPAAPKPRAAARKRARRA